MRREWTAIVAAFLLAVLPAAAAADRYEPDIPHSSIEFKIRHLGLSKVNGRFTQYQGFVDYDEDAIDRSGASFVIQTASVDTGNEKRDAHLRTADFFDAEKNPEIRFESTAVEREGENWVLRGVLDMHGVKREIAFPFEVIGPVEDPWGGTRVGFEATLKINREDWGVGWENLQYRPPLIGNEVEIEIALEMIRKS
ncbi:MAG: YceI family protein [Candidatus Eisenbacteria bacterium]|nr:YceI family protein [Candidatus Eisenbacteria bacterium]